MLYLRLALLEEKLLCSLHPKKRYKKLQVPLIDFCLEFLTEGITGSRKMFSFFKDLITQTDFSQYLSA